MSRLKRLFLILLPVLVLGLAAHAAPAIPRSRTFSPVELDTIRARLVAGGLEESFIRTLRLDTLHCYQGRLELRLHYKEGRTTYAEFRKPETIRMLREFMAERSSLLSAAERKHGVPAEVLGAILMIESSLGKNTGHYRAPDLFLTLLLNEHATSVIMLDSALVREVRNGGKRSREELRRTLETRASDRAKWALKEFRTLALQVAPDEWNTLACSWAGAIGLPQFMPTSLLAYGDDGDGDGHVDLRNLDDSVYSIGCYLKENGWRGQMNEGKRRKAVGRYNHSEAYVTAVLGLARAVGMP